jgi:hypothetical protein
MGPRQGAPVLGPPSPSLPPYQKKLRQPLLPPSLPRSFPTKKYFKTRMRGRRGGMASIFSSM